MQAQRAFACACLWAGLSVLSGGNASSLEASAPRVEWYKACGSGLYDFGNCVAETPDGGAIAAGATKDCVECYQELTIVKTDRSGALVWERNLASGDVQGTAANCLQPTSDGGYVIAGQGGGEGFILLLKVAGDGEPEWARHLGTYSYTDAGNWATEVSGGGYVLTGTMSSRLYLVKTSAVGDKVWENLLPGYGTAEGLCVRETKDGGIIVAGGTRGGVQNHSYTYVVKTDPDGRILWENQIGGPPGIDAYVVEECVDGGYLLAGTKSSICQVLKIDAAGELLWQKEIARVDPMAHRKVAGGSTGLDGGFFVAATVHLYSENEDGIGLFQLDSAGDLLWQTYFQVPGGSYVFGACPAADGSFLLTGTTSFSYPGNRFLLLKASSKGKLFVRGDADGDGMVNLTDAIVILTNLFLTGGPFACEAAADGNDNGRVTSDGVTDAVYILNFLFLGGRAPQPPFPDLGADPIPDGLPCGSP